MVLVRAILMLAILAMTPMNVAAAAGLPFAAQSETMAHTAMPDCCQDSSHRTPACQMQTELRETAPLVAPDRPAHALRIAFRAERLTGRMPDPAQPPPRRI